MDIQEKAPKTPIFGLWITAVDKVGKCGIEGGQKGVSRPWPRSEDIHRVSATFAQVIHRTYPQNLNKV